MTRHPAIEELIDRRLIKQSTDILTISKLLDEGSAVYCGFDPTADSLHIGSLLPLNVMKIFMKHGVKVIALVGGATGMIGDPSFKSSERTLMTEEEVHTNCRGIVSSIKSILGDVEFANNINWTRNMTVLNFLRTYGKCFTVNNMISKESVRARIEREDQGISFTEFTYPILQGMDFEVLYDMRNCKIQIGGSDQWGNMVAGIDVIHKLHGNEADVGAITIPLMTKSDGTKFGKSESGTIWLDKNKTTPYDFFQFWQNITDEEALKFIPMFTDMHTKNVDIRTLKYLFAVHMTELVHGTDMAESVADIVFHLFNGEPVNSEICKEMINCGLKSNEETFSSMVELLVKTNMASSNKMAREFISNGAIKVNKKKVNEYSDEDLTDLLKSQEYVLLQRGKNMFTVIKTSGYSV